MRTFPSSRFHGFGRPLAFGGLFTVVVFSALVPWVKNRGLINDFYDYGVTIAAVGRIAEGERPYRDFVSPLQTGGFLLNGFSEAMFGRTFQGMTVGAAVLIVVAIAVFAWLLSHRLHPIAGLTMSAALVWSAACQHTIVWYNAIGVVCLAVVGWSGALAPVLRREHTVLHALLGLALFLGGINKASFQLIALAVALAWPIRAAIVGTATWSRVALTAGLILAAGVVTPILFELYWTGVGFATWWYNVVALPGGGRSQDLMAALSPRFYLEHHHNYYGYLPVPWLGLLGLMMSVWVLGCGLWQSKAGNGWDRLLLLGAVIVAVGAGVALLATNKEIAYISFAGWAVLLVAVWLGFGLHVRSWHFAVGLMLPCVVIGVFAWGAAWRGQRALWGYSPHPKEGYLPGDSSGAAFAYLRGTRIPPEWVMSLKDLSRVRETMSDTEKSEMFYGSGTEWLERIWQARKVPGIPLFLDYGTSYSPREMRQLCEAISPGGAYRRVLVTVQRDVWFGPSSTVIERHYVRTRRGPALVSYERGNVDGVSINPLEFIAKHGGNVDSNRLESQMEWHSLNDGRWFIGTLEGAGQLKLTVPLRRFRGEMLLKRIATEDSFYADFLVAAVPEDAPPYDRVRRRVELPAGSDEVVMEFEGDVDGLPLVFNVTLPSEANGRVVAGWRNLSILHSTETTGDPPVLRPKPWPHEQLNQAAMAALFGNRRHPARVFTRGGYLAPDGFMLPPGGELWLRGDNGYTPVSGHGRVRPEDAGKRGPVLRAFWYRGGRLSITTQEGSENGRVNFRIWSAEDGGWVAMTVDADEQSAPIVVRFDELP